MTEKPRDGWDIASTLSQIISGTIIALVGLGITYELGRASGIQSQAALDATNRQISSQFLSKLTDSTGEARAKLLDTVDIAMSDDVGAHMAVRFAIPTTVFTDFPTKLTTETDAEKQKQQAVGQELSADWQALERIRHAESLPELVALRKESPDKHTKSALEEIRDSGVIPDADVAADILDSPVVPYMRISQIDDIVRVTVNGQPVLKPYVYGDDTDWIDLTPFLAKDKDTGIDLTVHNLIEGAGVRLALRLGKEQYDRVIRCEDCAEQADVLRVHVNIREHNGKYHLNSQTIHHLPEVDPAKKRR